MADIDIDSIKREARSVIWSEDSSTPTMSINTRTHSPHTPPSPSIPSAPTRRAHSPALVPSQQACAVNGEDTHGHQARSSDMFSEDTGTSGSYRTLPHLWADSRSPTTTSTGNTMHGLQQANEAITLNQEHIDNAASPRLATYAALYTAATAPVLNTAWRSPSSLSSNSEQDNHHHNDINRFSIASTTATSEGCHNACNNSSSIDSASNKHNSLLAGVMEGATAQDEEVIRDDTPPSVGAIQPLGTSDSIEVIDERTIALLDGAVPAEESYSATASLDALPSSSRMQDHPSPSGYKGSVSEATLPTDIDSESGRRLSSSISVRSTCYANTTSIPNHQKRSFLSSILSRSASVNGNRTGNEGPNRKRTVSSTSRRQLQNIPSSASTSSLSGNGSRSSTSIATQHARHSSNPPPLPSSISTDAPPPLYATITPASPLPEGMLSSTQASTSTSSIPSTSLIAENRATGVEGMRRSSSSLGPLAPLPNDSVFSNASRGAYIDESSSTPYARTVSPSPSSFSHQQQSGNQTPSSRAARYLSRHFASPSSSSSSAPIANNAQRFGEAQENLRRSPTPTRFFGASNNIPRSNNMPYPSSNNSSSSLPIGSNQKDGTTSSIASPAIIPPLSIFGLELKQISTSLTLSKFGQVLCGTILDEKYLLIGTTLGLHFLPLHRQGNKFIKSSLLKEVSNSISERFNLSENGSSSTLNQGSSGNSNNTSTGGGQTDDNYLNLNRKVRKPISLIKKTKFKQLIILNERSNILITIAGRNDHVRVYNLDSLRKLIEKKMKDYVDTPSFNSNSSTSISNKGLGLSLPPIKKGSNLSDVKGKGRAVPALSTSISNGQPSNIQTRAELQSQIMQRQYSPPPSYDHPRTSAAVAISPQAISSPSSSSITNSSPALPDSSTSGSSSIGTSSPYQQSPFVSNESQSPGRRRKTNESEIGLASSSSSPRVTSPSPSSSSFMRRGSQSPREHVVSSPRSAMRRSKSRETLRRPSIGSPPAMPGVSQFGDIMNSSSRSNSRRGSAATVTPDNFHSSSSSSHTGSTGRRRGSVATTIIPTSPSVSTFMNSNYTSTTVTRRGSTAQLADMGQVTSEQHIPRYISGNNEGDNGEDEDSYEWIDTPDPSETSSGYTFPPHPVAPWREIPAVPPLPEQYANSASVSAAGNRVRSPSTTSGYSNRLKMTPRAARVRTEVELEGEDQDSIFASAQESANNNEATALSASAVASGSPIGEEDQQRRQAMKKRRVSLAEILRETEPESFGAPSTAREAASEPIPSISRFSTPGSARIASGSTSRFVARSAVAQSSHGALADLADFLNEGPSEAASSRLNTARPPTTPKLFRSTTSASVPDMKQVEGGESVVTGSSLNARAPSLRSLASGSPRPKFTPREATTPKRDLEAQDSFMDFLREGPPDVPAVLSTLPSSIAGNVQASSRSASSRKLHKGSSRSSMSLRSKISTRSAPPPPLRTSASGTLQPDVVQLHTSSSDSHNDPATRIRTRSDGATLSRGGNFILPADEVVPVPVSVTTPASVDSLTAKTRKRRSMQPRSPAVRKFGTEVESQPMVSGLSFQEMLANSRIGTTLLDDIESPVLGSEDDTATMAGPRPSSVASGEASIREATSAARSRRNRWSILSGLRSAPMESDELVHGQAASQILEAAESGAASFSTSNAAVGLPHRHVVTSVTTSVATGTGPPPPILKPSRSGLFAEEDSPPFGNLTPDMQNQIASGSTDPDGTTIMFTQQASRSRSNGDTTSVASAVNSISGLSYSGMSNGSRNNGGFQKESASGNLEYVKLARTKGSRFIRASETAKKTYLAVLCGDQGERIELFTGAKNVSLSLNRTFVLPETPRTIEFQLQGDDLLDLYLIYDSAIFALEPSTVRVREVGIQRHERRQARRERERILRQAGALDGIDTSQPPSSPTTPVTRLPRSREVSGVSAENPIPNIEEAGSSSTTRADPTETQAPSIPTAPSQEALPASEETPDLERPVVESALEPAAGIGRVTETTIGRATGFSRMEDVNDNTASTVGVGASGQAVDSQQLSTSVLPYTTFQQLEYLPHIPPSVLASSYTIPPTYESVLSSSPNPEAMNGMFINSQPSIDSTSRSTISTSVESKASPDQQIQSTPDRSRPANPSSGSISTSIFPSATHLTPDWRWSLDQQQQQTDASPLLSPVSLLANPSARNAGPPGLFFLSKGKNSTGIVDGDGRSVIRQAISWLGPNEDPLELPEKYEGLDHFSRMEVLLTAEDKSRVCVAAFGPTSVRVIELGHPTQSHSIEVIPYEAFKKQQKSMNMTKMRSSGRDIPDELMYVRDVAYLAKAGQCAFFAESVGGNFAIYSLGAVGYTFH